MRLTKFSYDFYETDCFYINFQFIIFIKIVGLFNLFETLDANRKKFFEPFEIQMFFFVQSKCFQDLIKKNRSTVRLKTAV